MLNIFYKTKVAKPSIGLRNRELQSIVNIKKINLWYFRVEKHKKYEFKTKK
jgi:hypothetical protein